MIISKTSNISDLLSLQKMVLKTKASGSGTLMRLAENDQNRIDITNAGAIPDFCYTEIIR